MSDIRKYIELLESMERQHPIDDIKRKVVNNFPLVLPKIMYHATRKSNLESIYKQGLNPKYYGDIHGSMDISPNVNTVYLSRHEYSNNLNSNLYHYDEEIVVLSIDTSGIDPNTVYPDDALFVGFGQEDVFEDAEEIAEELGLSEDEAEELLEYFEETNNLDMADAMKFLWGWYVKEHGEISTSQVIPPTAIKNIKRFPK